MFIVERRYLLKMAATGSPGAIVQVPWNSEEPVQNLACWIYTPDQGVNLLQPNGGIAPGHTPTTLGGGSAQIFRGGVAIGSATAFPSASLLILPGDIVTVGTDATFETIHPQTTNPQGTLGRLQGVYVAGVFDNSSPAFKALQYQEPSLKTYVTITNTDAAAKDIIVHWMGLAWRNT
jgi:hypothetical protein